MSASATATSCACASTPRVRPAAYTGVREYLAIFLAGKLDQMGVTREQCKDAAYAPFPELERLTR